MQAPVRCHIPLIVWGESYLSTYLRLSLPSQMTPGNFEYLAAHTEVYYYLFTPKKEFEFLQTQPIFQRLMNLVTLKWIELRDCDLSNKFHLVNKCHAKVIQDVGTTGPMFFPYPDQIFAEDSYRTLYQLALGGKRLVMTIALRTWLEKFSELFALQKSAFPLPARSLAKLALQALHPYYATSLMWESEEINTSASQLFWKLGDEGLLVRAFHLHPYMIWPEREDKEPFVGIESIFQYTVCPRPESWKVITDSDELFSIEVSSERVSGPVVKRSMEFMMHWMHRYTTAFQRQFLAYRKIIHSDGIQKSWDPLIAQSDQVVKALYERYRNPKLVDRIDRLDFFLRNKLRRHKRKLLALFRKS